MAKNPVLFKFLTGIKKDKFDNVRLWGSWDRNGFYSGEWTSVPMQKMNHTDGCPSFQAKAEFDDSQTGRLFYWGVTLDGPAGKNMWGITTQVNTEASTERTRTFRLNAPMAAGQQTEVYYLTHCSRLGATKYYSAKRTANPGIQFNVWAPNAEKVEVVFGDLKTGYIANDGRGIDNSMPVLEMTKGNEGIWATNPKSDFLADFSKLDHKPYMYRIYKKGDTRFQRPVYRTDLYSRCQIGGGKFDPKGAHYNGHYTDLDGTVSCSVVIDTALVAKDFESASSMNPLFTSEEKFWQDDDLHRAKLPKRVEDLIIYELHVGALGFGKTDSQGNHIPGDLTDAMKFLDHIVELGVNCVELLPMSEFEGFSWGYGTSHHFAVEYNSGGRDQFKHFIRECHHRGIAVIQDVVYNHYDPDAERSEWAYDSDTPEENIYYWYEGKASGYPFPEGGYLDNMSTGFAPRFYEEIVRKMFISSAVALVEDFHIDGFRVDQTTSIHSYNGLHKDGSPVGRANVFGRKFLTELNITLKLINPYIIVIAEDHSDWDMVIKPLNEGGMGFDAAWYVEFFHNLMGSSGNRVNNARLIKLAGYGNDDTLRMDYFAGSLLWSGQKKVVYHESHDEAGNSENSARTIVVASNFAPLVGDTRKYAEARSRFAFGMSILSAGTPMFLFGEEVGAWQPYRYNDFMNYKDDIIGIKNSYGKFLFKFYTDLIAFCKSHDIFRNHNLKVFHVHNDNRVIAFARFDDNKEFFIAASLNNNPFSAGYQLTGAPGGNAEWREVFNSDSVLYGGDNIGNNGAGLRSFDGSINVIIPANGFVVFQKILNVYG